MRAMGLRWLCLLACAALACGGGGRDSGPPAERAFYFWRTTFELTPAERAVLAEQRVTKLYVRAFDVEWSAGEQRATPIGKLAVKDAPPAGVAIVPVVFVRQDVFHHVPRADLAGFAKQTWDEIVRRMKPLGVSPTELQLDCDWTDRSRDAFFEYVRQVRAAAGGEVQLSSTIRLHQVKYRERTGVPPVDRGTLMFYNMGEISAEPGSRAIFDPDAAEKYLARLATYPLPLDLALPIYSWTVHVRDDVVVDLLQATDPDELSRHDFLERVDAERFRATRTAFLHGALLREGDVLKAERLTPADTLAAAELVRPHLPSSPSGEGPRTLILFDLSERNLHRYAAAQLDEIFRSAR